MKEKLILQNNNINSLLDLVSETNQEEELNKLLDYSLILEKLLLEKDEMSLIKDFFNEGKLGNYEFSLARLSLVNAYYKMNLEQTKKENIYKILDIDYLHSNIDSNFLLGKTLLISGDDPDLGLKNITEASLMGNRQARTFMDSLLKDENIKNKQFYDVLDLSQEDIDKIDKIDKTDLSDIRYTGRENG